MPLELANIRSLVETGMFLQLIGEFEGQHLDAKAQPYAFTKNDAKREFAKDVASFANATGGCIVLGAETAISNLQAGEQITALRPFPETLFNPDQYRKILEEWLYPVPRGLIINWYPDKDTQKNGIGVIFIPTQSPDTKPFLLTRTIGDKKTTETLLGYVERHLDRTDIKSVVELHHAMRTGMNLEATLLNRITNIEALLKRQLLTPIPRPDSTAKRVGRILAQQQFSDTRTLVIIVSPLPRSELQSIFSDQLNSIRRTIENPPEIRAHGWGIRTGGAAQFIDGDFLQTESYRNVVNLYRDGELIVGARVDRDSLAWADTTDSRFHPLAFVEFVTNTLRFFSLVLMDMFEKPQSLEIEVRLRNLFRDSKKTSLPAGTINNVGLTFGSKQAPAAEWSRTITVDASTYNPQRTAFLFLREVYGWFGHSEEAIPYTIGVGDNKKIDVPTIAMIR
jgi:hypothetical protein